MESFTKSWHCLGVPSKPASVQTFVVTSRRYDDNLLRRVKTRRRSNTLKFFYFDESSSLVNILVQPCCLWSLCGLIHSWARYLVYSRNSYTGNAPGRNWTRKVATTMCLNTLSCVHRYWHISTVTSRETSTRDSPFCYSSCLHMCRRSSLGARAEPPSGWSCILSFHKQTVALVTRYSP